MGPALGAKREHFPAPTCADYANPMSFSQALSATMCSLALSASLGLSACGADTSDQVAPTAQSAQSSSAAAAPTATAPIDQGEGIATVRFDVGEVSTDGHTAPVRGSLTLPATKPDSQPGSHPLIVLNHLRAPNCDDDTFALPCPAGTTALRYDEGMDYLAVELARAGYATLVPDLTGLWVGEGLEEPYDQRAMYADTLALIREKLPEITPAAETIDMHRVGVISHSRSGQLINTVVDFFGADAVRGALSYAPAYDTFELESFSPPVADVPYLAIDSTSDADVGASANAWAGHYLTQERSTALIVATTQGLGHYGINRTLTGAGKDDRRACDIEHCPSAAEHERILTEAALTWFAPLTGGTLPDLGQLQQAISLPDDARWLAASPATPGAGKVVRLAPEAFSATPGSVAKVCFHPDPMDPTSHGDNACPMPEVGVMLVATPVLHVDGAARASVDATASQLAVHVVPFGSGEPTELTVTITTTDGATHTLVVPADHPALQDRATETSNGEYVLATVRLTLPEEVATDRITTVEVAANRPVELRGVDLF